MLMKSILFVSFAQKETYNLILYQSPDLSQQKEYTRYVYPNVYEGPSYTFKVVSNIADNTKEEFEVVISNGRNSTIAKRTENFNVNGNTPFYVVWDDVRGEGKVRVLLKSPSDSVKLERSELSYTIASLKGLTPVVSSSRIPLFGDAGTITILGKQHQLAYHPEVVDSLPFGGTKSKLVQMYEWRVPKGWIVKPAYRGENGVYISESLDVEIITDYFSMGGVSVRGVNDLYSAFSEVYEIMMDPSRGFRVENRPQSIKFGEDRSFNYSVTLAKGVEYIWQAPKGWMINGGTNQLSGIGRNSVIITPSFCDKDTTVLVRFKKGEELSEWVSIHTSMVGWPKLTISNQSDFFQFEKARASLGLEKGDALGNIRWHGDNILIVEGQGTTSCSFIPLNFGPAKIAVEFTPRSCTQAFRDSCIVDVRPHRFSINGPAAVCDAADFTIDNLPSDYEVRWEASDGITLLHYGNKCQIVHNNITLGSIAASIKSNGKELIKLKKDISVGVPSFSIIRSQNCYESLGEIGFGFFASPEGGFPSTFYEESIDYHWRCIEVSSGTEIYNRSFYNTSFKDLQPFISFPRAGRYRVEMVARKDGGCTSPIAVYEMDVDPECANNGY